MRDGGTRPLVFLGACLAFAETTLGTLATFAGTSGTLAAVFALVSLGMVLSALVAMYWRDPAFLTFSSREALDLRMLELLRDRLTPELLSLYVQSLRPYGTHRGVTRGRRPGEESEIEGVLEILEG